MILFKILFYLIPENIVEYVVCNMAVVLSRSQYTKSWTQMIKARTFVQWIHLDPSSTEAGIFRDDFANIMTAAEAPPCAATQQYWQYLDFHEAGFNQIINQDVGEISDLSQ